VPDSGARELGGSPNVRAPFSFFGLEASRHDIVPPAVLFCEVSFCEVGVADSRSQVRGRDGAHHTVAQAHDPILRPMRRWVCVIALLFGFAGDRYAWSVRPMPQIPIERPIEGDARGSTTGHWWRIA
jgi:hypothetical protein